MLHPPLCQAPHHTRRITSLGLSFVQISSLFDCVWFKHNYPKENMPRLETDVKLDFKDVLIRPKRSTLKSRSQVSLDRTYTFKNSNYTFTGVPIMAANM